jgi:hypothetical protein
MRAAFTGVSPYYLFAFATEQCKNISLLLNRLFSPVTVNGQYIYYQEVYRNGTY